MNQLARLEQLMHETSDDNDTLLGHTSRVADLAGSLATLVGVSAEVLAVVRLAGRLHDVGKLSVDTRVLSKPGPLDPDELMAIRRHPTIGGDLVEDLVPASVRAAILHHHERWDGFGYPAGLAHEQIPLASRLILVVDAFDAMTSQRCYQPAMSIDWTLSEIRRNAGTQFDPSLATIFADAVESAEINPVLAPLPPDTSPVSSWDSRSVGLRFAETEVDAGLESNIGGA